MSLLIPSYKTGFARNAAESEYPELWRGLVGLWSPALGPTGLTLHDWSGNQNHGTLTNMDASTDWVVGEKGYALDYDTTAQIFLGDISEAEGVGDFSFLIWVMVRDGDSDNDLIVKGRHASGGPLILWYDNAAIDYWNFLITDDDLDTTGVLSSAGAASDFLNKWVFLALVLRGGQNVRFYINGIEDGNSPFATVDVNGINSNADAYRLGHDNRVGDTQALDGQTGPVSIYNRALSANEIAQMYAGANPLMPKRRSLAKIPISLLLRQSNIYGNLQRLNGGL